MTQTAVVAWTQRGELEDEEERGLWKFHLEEHGPLTALANANNARNEQSRQGSEGAEGAV